MGQLGRVAYSATTFANLGSVRLPSLKFVGLRVRKIRCIYCVSCLSTTVSQLFEPQFQKIVIFTYIFYVLHFLFALGTPLRQSRKTLHELKDNSVLAKPPCSMYPSILNSFPVIRTASAKNRRFHIPQPTFLFPLETPLRLSHNMLHGWKDNSMLAKRLAACTYLSSIQ